MSISKTWSQFTSTRKTDKAVLHFRIQEATVDNHEHILKFFQQYYINSETLNKAAGICKSKGAIKELFCTMYDLTGSTLLICYLDEDSNTESLIVGTSMIILNSASDKNKLPEIISKVKTPEVKRLLNTICKIKDLTSGIKTLGIDKWYDVVRIAVHPDYTGLGIAGEFLKVGRDMCIEQKVPAVCAWTTAIGSQKAAERNGWRTYYKISFEELGRHCGCEFNDTPPSFKAMIAFVDQ